MTKIEAFVQLCNTQTFPDSPFLPVVGSPGYLLDTLEISATKREPLPSERYAKWTIAKRESYKNSLKLSSIDSPLNKHYTSSLDCRHIMLQEGNVFRAMTCKKRWCKACNNVRTAELINGYSHLLEEMENPYYLVLTSKNCKRRQLRSMTQRGFDQIKKFRNKLQRKGIKVDGLVTVECTYNEAEDTYHYHYNLIVNTKEVGEYILAEWLNYHGKNAVRKAQFLSPLREKNDLLEVFKYVTKMTIETEEAAKAQDAIYRAYDGMRILRPFGNLRKAKPDHTDTFCETVTDAEEKTEIWFYEPDTMHYENSRLQTLSNDADIAEYMTTKRQKKKKGRKPYKPINNAVQALKMAHNGNT